MRITQSQFGITADGQVVTAYKMENSRGAWVTVMDYGATVLSIGVPDKMGKLTDVVLGYGELASYENDDAYMGATVGRMCNRVGKGQFRLNGKTYQLALNAGVNHSHGGWVGFNRKLWQVAVLEDGLRCSLLSPDGDEGYPGNLQVQVTFRLSEKNALTISYDAVSDEDTIMNLTNHSYYNLNGGGTAMKHHLQINAQRFLETDVNGLPTGKYLDVDGTPFDFCTTKVVGEAICGSHPQLTIGHGYDHTYVLSGRLAAKLHSPESGITMKVMTDLPGMQLYTSNFLSERTGKYGAMRPRDAICLETQLFPDGMAHYSFPTPVLRAGEQVHFESQYIFSVERGSL